MRLEFRAICSIFSVTSQCVYDLMWVQNETRKLSKLDHVLHGTLFFLFWYIGTIGVKGFCISFLWPLYITSYTTNLVLKTIKIIFSQSCRPKVQNQGFHPATLPQEALGRILPYLFQLLVATGFSRLPVAVAVSFQSLLCLHIALSSVSFLLSQISLCLSLIRTS